MSAGMAVASVCPTPAIGYPWGVLSSSLLGELRCCACRRCMALRGKLWRPLGNGYRDGSYQCRFAHAKMALPTLELGELLLLFVRVWATNAVSKVRHLPVEGAWRLSCPTTWPNFASPTFTILSLHTRTLESSAVNSKPGLTVSRRILSMFLQFSLATSILQIRGNPGFRSDVLFPILRLHVRVLCKFINEGG